jgi:hypothetical protein
LTNTAHPTYMKKYPDHSPTVEGLRDAPPSDVLEFPVAPGYISRPPRIELQAMLRRIEENLPIRNRRPGEAERRLAEKIPAEFVL